VRPGRERLAAIDVGSNTVLLTVADWDGGDGLTVVEEGDDQPRLAAGLGSTGRLSDAAMERALETLTRMRKRCGSLGVQRLTAVATAAVREAANGGDFLARARARDIPLRIISQDTEAALAYRSAAYRFPGTDRMLVADIGGGSLELVGAKNGSVRMAHSLPLGAVRLTELQLTPNQLQEHIAGLLATSLASEWQSARLVGSGGTFATLAGMVLAQRGREGQQVHGTIVDEAEVKRMLESLGAMSPAERRQVPGLKPERADIILAGLAVVTELLKVVEASKVSVSGFGLRDGLLLEMAGLK
jgi:exopolyphosphatase / guanosine-5'-triphosphate,3'-diphosphate pyrophosphatase